MEQKPFSRILVALDGSTAAEQVLPYVEQFVQAFGSQLLFVRISNPDVDHGTDASVMTRTEENTAVAEPTAVAASEGMTGAGAIGGTAPMPVPVSGRQPRPGSVDDQNAVGYVHILAREWQERGYKVSHEVLEGAPAEAIVERATAMNADLIALTGRHKGALQRIFSGDVSDSVIHKAPCPVFFVPLRDEG